MEPVVVAVIAATAPTLAALAQWADMRRRTNGSGPLAAKLDEQAGRLTRIEERTARTEERCARIERAMASEIRARRQGK